MKKVFIFDFDGVLFIDPTKLRLQLVRKYSEPFQWRIHDNPFDVPTDIPEGIQLEEDCRNVYHSNTMPEHHKQRLRDIAKTHHLVIASYNTHKNIVEMLTVSGIVDLFEQILTKETHVDKKSMFQVILNTYNCEASFITDTRHDVDQVRLLPADSAITTYVTDTQLVSENIKFMADFFTSKTS